jgi:hypothetical protein
LAHQKQPQEKTNYNSGIDYILEIGTILVVPVLYRAIKEIKLKMYWIPRQTLNSNTFDII